MKENLQDIDQYFKNPIEDYAEMPSEKVWNGIEKSFDITYHLRLKKKYDSLKKVAAVLLLLLCGTVGYLMYKNKSITIIDTVKVVEPNNEKNKYNNFLKNNLNINDSNTKITLAKSDEKNISSTLYGLENENGSITKNVKKSISENSQPNNKPYIFTKKSIYKKAKQSLSITNAEIDKLKQENRYGNVEFKEPINTTKSLTPIIFNADKIVLGQANFISKINLLDSKNNFGVPNIYTKFKSDSKKKSFSISAFISPEITLYREEDDQPHQNRQPPPPNRTRPPNDRNKLKREESNSSSYSFGVMVDYNLNNKISLQTGVHFVSKTITTNPKKIFAEQTPIGDVKFKYNCTFGESYINPKTGQVAIVGDSATLDKAKNTVQYISIPLNFLYTLPIGKFKIIPSLGVAANFLVSQNITTNIEGSDKQNIKTIEGVNANYFNANIGIGLGYALYKKIDIIAAPNFKFALNPLNTNSNVKLYPNTFGVMVGVKYNF